jgi:hypothetical protein
MRLVPGDVRLLKEGRNLVHATALFIADFNFCRVHSALKVKVTETTPAQERTPAMAAGLTDHVWTAGELIAPKEQN